MQRLSSQGRGDRGMRAGVRAIAVVAVAVMLAATPGAPAAAKGGHGSPKGGGFSAYSFTWNTCGDGATCDATAHAGRRGHQSTAASISRAAPTLPFEYSMGIGHNGTTVKLRQAAPAVEIAYTWRVDEAVTHARAAAGDGATVARVFLRGLVVHSHCDDCVIEDSTDGYGERIADSYDPGLIALGVDDAAVPGTEVTHTIVLRGPGGGMVPTGTLSMVGSTLAFVYVGGVCATVAVDSALGDDEPLLAHQDCVPEPVGHAGSATARASTHLLNITVQPA